MVLLHPIPNVNSRPVILRSPFLACYFISVEESRERLQGRFFRVSIENPPAGPPTMNPMGFIAE
jgi:hypothetical protein